MRYRSCWGYGVLLVVMACADSGDPELPAQADASGGVAPAAASPDAGTDPNDASADVASDGGRDGSTGPVGKDAGVRDAARDTEAEAAVDSDASPVSEAGSPKDGATRDILEPAQGAWLGIFYGAQSLAVTEAKLGRKVPLHLTYVAWNDDWPAQVAARDLEADRIPFVNWEPSSPKLDDIIQGRYDAMLQMRAQAAKKLAAPFFLDFGAEMNGDWSPWGGAQNGMSAQKWVEAYRHIHDVFTSEGADNVVWAFCPNVTDEPRAAWNEALGYYPGDAYVDWMCVDGYNWGSSGGGDGWQSFQSVFARIYPTLATKNKPILIGEMASAEVGGDKAQWIDGIIPTLRAEFPMIKALIWFDINKETDWRISSSAASEQAFVRLANDPYFNP